VAHVRSRPGSWSGSACWGGAVIAPRWQMHRAEAGEQERVEALGPSDKQGAALRREPGASPRPRDLPALPDRPGSGHPEREAVPNRRPLPPPPGGSSGGSAAALAAGLTGIDAGSDIGGSIRNPAHYCGVFGLKPTWGVIAPKGQALPGAHAYADISVIGPLTRGAEDLDLALDAMAGPDEIDGAAWKLDLPACDAKSLRDLRVAVKLTDPNSDVDAEYSDKLQALVDALAKRGARVKEIEPKLDTGRLHEVYVLLLRAATSVRTPEVDIERWRQAAIEIGAAKEPYLDRTVRGNTLSHRDWLKLNNERHGLRRAFAAFFADWDVLLCPAAASAAWPHDQKGERWTRKIMVNGTQVPSTDQLFWAGYSSLVYLPSTVGPAGLTKSGLPVGYQAIAASGRDKTATAFSRLVEKEIAGFVPPPGFD
jgi:amidase